MQAVHHHFSFAKRDSLKTIVFEESEIFLGIPEDGINQDGWQIIPTSYPVVRMEGPNECLYADTYILVSWKNHNFCTVW